MIARLAPWVVAALAILALAAATAFFKSALRTARLETSIATTKLTAREHDLAVCVATVKNSEGALVDERARATEAAATCVAEQERLRRLVGACATAEAAVERLNSLGGP